MPSGAGRSVAIPRGHGPRLEPALKNDIDVRLRVFRLPLHSGDRSAVGQLDLGFFFLDAKHILCHDPDLEIGVDRLRDVEIEQRLLIAALDLAPLAVESLDDEGWLIVEGESRGRRRRRMAPFQPDIGVTRGGMSLTPK